MNKRMRVFAGPNGSGKSSIIKYTLNVEVQEGKKLDFGIYINAEDITSDLQKGKGLIFSQYEIDFSELEFFDIVRNSGLISGQFPELRFRECIFFKKNKLLINKNRIEENNDNAIERIAQILADYLRKKLLSIGKKFSFETVFSHKGKVDIFKKAKDEGYKVYLYFVSTEHPEINVYRVKKVRVPHNGHDVPESKIISRYYRSMDLLYEAAQHCYQCYFFDNSAEGEKQTLFAHFKLNAKGEKEWDNLDENNIPNWFKKYYSAKIQ